MHDIYKIFSTCTERDQIENVSALYLCVHTNVHILQTMEKVFLSKRYYENTNITKLYEMMNYDAEKLKALSKFIKKSKSALVVKYRQMK